jgi:hypothetical protein
MCGTCALLWHCPWPALFQRLAIGLPGHAVNARRRGACPRRLVRPLHRYYTAVRLPAPVAHRRTPEGFTMRTAPSASRRRAVRRGISRFPDELLAHVHRVSDRAGSGAPSPKRAHQFRLRLISTASAPQTTRTLRHGACISRLNTWPVRTPVNASPAPLPVHTHDSGPPWLARPSTYETFIHNNSPV